MAIIALAHYNKNQFRKYPLKQGSSCMADDGYVLPDDAFVGCSLTSVYGKHRLYIKQIFYKNNTIRVTIGSVFDSSALGVFSGAITENFTNLKLTPFTRFISGNLTIGSVATLGAINRILNFEPTTTELEESSIFCYTPPAVTSVLDKKNNELRGSVNFGLLTNLTKKTVAKGTELTALNPSAIFNPSDKSTFLGNCSNPMITNINGVTPTPAGVGEPVNDCNIYIAGVKPIMFFGIPGEDNSPIAGTIGIETSSISLDRLCTQKHKLLPPVDITGFTLDSSLFKNMYYSKPAMPANPIGSENYPLPRPARLASNFNATLKPEYYYWPQFVKAEYYDYWSTPKQQ